MKKSLISLFTMLLLPFFIFAQQAPVDSAVSNPRSYEKMIRTGSTLKIVGGSSMALGLGLMIAGGSKNMTSLGVSVITIGSTPYDEDAGNTEAVIGAILFFGGVGVLIGGIATSSKAKKLKRSGQISLMPYVPPLQVAPKAYIPQQGLSMAIPIGK